METDRYYESVCSETLQKISSEDAKLAAVAQQWDSAVKRELKEYDGHPVQSDAESFGEKYQNLMKTAPSCVTVLVALESRFRKELNSIITHRDHELQLMATGSSQHRKMLEEDYGEKIAEMKMNQKGEYRVQVDKLFNKQRQRGVSITSHDLSPYSHRDDEVKSRSNSVLKCMEESFTIHLGAQLKSMHNLKIITLTPMDLCCSDQLRDNEASQRLNMSLNLYSSRLSGVVLFVSNSWDCHRSGKSEFYAVCERNPELHFAELNDQITAIHKDAKRANQWRQLQKALAHGECGSQSSNGSPSSNGIGIHKSASSETVTPTSDVLETGDVYVTRHSNLSYAHMVFHMVVDETLKTKEINSRHPCINGLRNVIRICMRFGVTTVSLPMLLIEEINEEIHSINWCLKRAELVFKCTKGFLMECSTLKTSGQQFNIQYLLPVDTPVDIFTAISDMLPTIYRVANPVVATNVISLARN